LARRISPPKVQHSFWDRLTNPDLVSGPVNPAAAQGEVERVKDEVRRDLEWLLNSRRPPVELPEGLTGLSKSLMSFGLPDVTGLSMNNTDDRERLQKTIETAVRDFEPRLNSVTVYFNPLDQDRVRSALHYRIEAMLRLDPVPEPIAFDTVLDLGSRAFTVKRDA